MSAKLHQTKNLATCILALVLCLVSVSSAHVADTGYPTLQQVRQYALEKNNPVPDSTKTTKVRSYLEAHVADLIRQGRWAPLFEFFGIRESSVIQTEPADIFLALSSAYPYLSPSLQTQVRDYLRNHWSTDQPYQNLDYPNLSAGTPRNWYQVEPPEFSSAVVRGNPIPNRRIQLYALYLFAQNTDSWDLVNAQYSKIKAVFDSIPSTLSTAYDGNNSRDISSVIAFIRIADKNDQPADVSAGVTKLSSLLQNKIDHQRIEGDNCGSTMDDPNDGQFRSNGCLYAGSTHQGIILTYYGMSPELGRVLRDYATTASATIKNWVFRNAQGYWFVRGDTPVQEGEVISPFYITTMAYFHILSDISAVSFDEHLQLIDSPAGHADTYYIQRLVAAIQASGNPNWVNYSQPMNQFDNPLLNP